MIYYPRPEHAMIQYDGKYMHHAIAIPEGEGRYILNRLNGKIQTIEGPRMYLPDPRTEVVVKRKLTEKECNLIYPNNNEVLEYNKTLSEKVVQKMAQRGKADMTTDMLNSMYATSNQEATLAIFEANANISRGTSYTKPRTITLDTKYDGAVAVGVWTGYAINVVSKTGEREVIVGPTTRLLKYDETLESMTLSTGRPKTTDNLLETAYLRVENNKISDLINVQTKDFVDVEIKVSYCVDFLESYKDKWFNVENYVKYMCDRERSLLKREAKQYSIEDFYANTADIVRKVALDLNTEHSENQRVGRFFPENGMLVHDVEVLSVNIEHHVAEILNEHQKEMITQALELSDAAKKMQMATQLAEYNRKETALQHENAIKSLELKIERETKEMDAKASLALKERTEAEAAKKAESDMQAILNDIQSAQLERKKKDDEAEIEKKKQLAEIEKARQAAYAETVSNIMKSISPDLVAAMNAKSNVDIMESLGKAVSPYSIAKGESIPDTINTLIRGTSFQDILKNLKSSEN
jgi:major vault protein